MQTIQRNRFVGVNYFPTSLNVAVPPEYVLQQFFDFDADLVLFPSTNVPFAYVIARRARRTGGMNIHDPAFHQAPPDTKYCVERHWLPVTLMYKTGLSWEVDRVLRELAARDIWRAGGAEAYAAQADEADEKKRNNIKKEIRDDMWNRSGDAWRSYQARTGQRTKYRYGHRTRTSQTAVQQSAT